MKGSKLRELRKKHSLTQAGLAEKVGLERKSIINYEQMDEIPDNKSVILDLFFDSLEKPSTKYELLKKNGVEFSMKEIAEYIANNDKGLANEVVFRLWLKTKVQEGVITILGE